MLLRQVLQEIESAQGPISLNDLSRKLGVEPSALEGMISFLVRKGRLQQDAASLHPDTGAIHASCTDQDCGSVCGRKRDIRGLTSH